jgi:hypothetical protein
VPVSFPTRSLRLLSQHYSLRKVTRSFWNLREGLIAEDLSSFHLVRLVLAVQKRPSLGANRLVLVTTCIIILLLGISEPKTFPSVHKSLVSSSISCSSAAYAANMLDVIARIDDPAILSHYTNTIMT